MFTLVQRTHCTASGTFLVCHGSVIEAAWKIFQGLTLSLYALLICKHVGLILSAGTLQFLGLDQQKRILQLFKHLQCLTKALQHFLRVERKKRREK